MRIVMLAAVAAGLTAGLASAQAPGRFVIQSSDQSRMVLVDRQSFARDGARATVWIITLFPASRTHPSVDISYDRSSELHEFDCEKRTARLLAVQVYNEATKANAAPRALPQGSAPVAPETYAEAQHALVCNAKPGMPVTRADTTVGRVADAWPIYRTILRQLEREAAAGR